MKLLHLINTLKTSLISWISVKNQNLKFMADCLRRLLACLLAYQDLKRHRHFKWTGLTIFFLVSKELFEHNLSARSRCKCYMCKFFDIHCKGPNIWSDCWILHPSNEPMHNAHWVKIFWSSSTSIGKIYQQLLWTSQTKVQITCYGSVEEIKNLSKYGRSKRFYKA